MTSFAVVLVYRWILLSLHEVHGPTAWHVVIICLYCLQETVTVDLYIIRKLGLFLRQFPQVGVNMDK